MSDSELDKTIEELEAEVIAELDEANKQPNDSGLAAEKGSKVEGERQDMGPAVVSPDAKTDPGDAATDKAKKAKKPGRDGKGLPSAASPKAQGDGNGPMSSSNEEVEEDETQEIVAETPEID